MVVIRFGGFDVNNEGYLFSSTSSSNQTDSVPYYTVIVSFFFQHPSINSSSSSIGVKAIMKTAIIASLAVILPAASAIGTPPMATLRSTECPGGSSDTEYNVAINNLTVIGNHNALLPYHDLYTNVQLDAQSICGLELTDYSSMGTTLDINLVSCQAYRDKEGKEKGSASFGAKNPALISTTPVQINAVRCVAGDPRLPPVTSTGVASPAGTGAVANGTAAPTPAPTGGNSTGPGVPGNPGVVPGSPGATGAPGTGNAAMRLGMSAGLSVLVGAVALFAL
ncbi:hypothetical protein BDV95DRAFT_303188 [Massariosphaeria phaeospora]|uniref:Uncharacterized protein n=1 Tax=Massariosphaeria phaeospora TaxID=100035 RepID=A0A7C8IKA1_9PLEO|nr:hypothetical protein BDV95DRAFT_303188 [Massariosphaeria phaeospora]